jgi:Domain of unknown function (DUF4160)
MPVVHRFGPYRFRFFANENRAINEPPHIHVESADGIATFWLSPVSLRNSWGYTPREIERIRRIVTTHRLELLRHWHDFFHERPDA